MTKHGEELDFDKEPASVFSLWGDVEWLSAESAMAVGWDTDPGSDAGLATSGD